MFPMQIDDKFELRPLTEADTPAMFALLNANRAHLDAWLRWSGWIQSLEDTRALIERFTLKTAVGDGFHAGMWLQGKLVGGLVCHYINRESRKTEIGYWLDAGHTGRGLVTRASRAVIAHLVRQEEMHRIEIQCMVDNRASRAVAERLGFTLEGIKRDSEWINGAFRDHAIYSLLAHELPSDFSSHA